MRNLAIIPARSGSKGLKDKNIKKMFGIPLMGYAIKAALDSKLFDIVMVSTDSEKYAEIARSFGAQVPFLRSDYTSSDTSSSWDAVNEVLQNYAKLGYEFETVTLLQPTSPLRTAEDIVQAHKVYSDKNANSVISVCETEHPPLWSNVIESDLSMKKFAQINYPAAYRQGLSVYYRLNGAIYIVNNEALKNIDNIYAKECYAYIMKQSHSIDIDSELDFIIAEAIIKSGICC